MTAAAAGASVGPRITALPLDEVVRILRTAGASTMDRDRIQADCAAGAPVNPDGTINLIAYGAWLIRSLAERERQHG